MTSAIIFTVLGLALDLAGALILAGGLFITPEEAVELSAARWSGSTLDENLRNPQAQDRLRQSKRAKWGAGLLALGFALQIIGALLR